MSYTNGLDKPTDYFNTVLYTGNNTDNTSITGVNFSPNWVWLKARNQADYHYSMDTVRGALKPLFQNDTSAEANFSDSLKSFDTDGFTLGTSGDLNAASQTMVSWNWKAGTSFTNDASATGIGSIDSAGSANDTAGFSICTHTGTGSLGTIKHGLSTKPSVILTKERSEARDWMMYHHKNTSAPATDFLLLNKTDATVDDANFMNDTEPTSSVFTVKGFSEVNKASQTYVSYIFSERQGYSKFGSYVGNGSTDGTFVYLGFKPAWVMIKNTTTAGKHWVIHDNKRNTFNPTNKELVAQGSGEEVDDTRFDFLSNGLKIRDSASYVNTSGDIYIYMAFAESPFVTSTGVPACAR